MGDETNRFDEFAELIKRLVAMADSNLKDARAQLASAKATVDAAEQDQAAVSREELVEAKRQVEAASEQVNTSANANMEFNRQLKLASAAWDGTAPQRSLPIRNDAVVRLLWYAADLGDSGLPQTLDFLTRTKPGWAKPT